MPTYDLPPDEPTPEPTELSPDPDNTVKEILEVGENLTIAIRDLTTAVDRLRKQAEVSELRRTTRGS